MVGWGYCTFINLTGRAAEQRVLPVCVSFNFTNRADIAPGQFLHGGAVASVENIKLADALGHAAVGVEKFHARLESA